MDNISVQSSLFCPVTGLPVKRPAHWQRQKLGPDYTVNYSLIGQSVVYSAPTGSVSLKEIRAGIAFTDKVAGQRPHPTRPFVMIYDLHALNSVTLKARRYFIQHHIETPQLLALVFCNVSPLVKIGIKIGQRFNTTKRQAYIAGDFAQAAVLALRICKKLDLEVGPYALGRQIMYDRHSRTLVPVELRSHEAWEIQSAQYANKSVVINHSILFSTSQGYLRPPDIHLIDRMRESVRTTVPKGCNLDYIDVPMSAEHPLHSIVQAIKLIKVELDELFAERKLAETALKKSEEKYRELFEKGSDWLCTHDLEGNLLETNFAFKTGVGFANRMSDPPNIIDMVPERYRDDVIGYLERIRHNGYDHGVMAVRMEGGRDIILEYSTVLVSDANGELTLVKGSARNITREIEASRERKRLEKKLHHAQKMESIGTLAGGIAHDFNNILSSIIGFTDLALEEAPDGIYLEENLLEVRKAGTRAKELANQILTFARQSDEQKSPIQAGLIAKEVLKLIRSTIPASIQILQRIESSALVMGNPTQIHQIFMNLCTNAAHAMGDKGGILKVVMVDVDLRAEEIQAHPGLRTGPYLRITVSDNGVGIPPNAIDLIFEPYYTTKAPGRGTGMGLATVHGIVQAYGGEISVDSAPGSGSVFTILLPACEKQITQNRRPDAQPPTGTERILFIDDEPAIVKMADRMLGRLGYQVTALTDSEQALEQFRRRPDAFDLVVTDLSMPKLTGDKLAQRLLNIRPDIPIVMWTGFSEKMSAERASRIGIKALHNKPITKIELACAVRTTLDTNAQPVLSHRGIQASEKIDG